MRAWCHYRFDEGQFERTWKQMAKQSERQLGCLFIAYGLETGHTYELDNKMVELRNKVVHQGYFPEETQVVEYGRHAFNDIRHLTKILEQKHPKALADAVAREMTERERKAPKGLPAVPFKRMTARLPEGTRTAVELTSFDELLAGVVHGRQGLIKMVAASEQPLGQPAASAEDTKSEQSPPGSDK